ncbi:glycosyltransferase family 2 protein [Methylobacterium tardum]|uniref:glycosyltransferase family 2 protein n=1 Tax=Methylobacterium tardum TaxID=374432 RepID=UPI00360E958D
MVPEALPRHARVRERSRHALPVARTGRGSRSQQGLRDPVLPPGLRSPVGSWGVAVPALRPDRAGGRAAGRARGSGHRPAHDRPRSPGLGRPAASPAHRSGPRRRHRPRLQGTRRDPARHPRLPVGPAANPFTLLAVNDRSPDPQLTAELADLARKGLFHLVENEQNLGFVRSVNRALSLRQGRAVVLLNSDAQVFGDWLDRLVAHAEPDAEPEAEPADAARPRVGSVTPLSNNATICSYPRFNANNTMPLEIDRPDLDRLAARINRGRAVPVPTGVGFCMYMTAEALDAVGPSTPRPSARATARRTTGACAPPRPASSTCSPRTSTSTMPARSRSGWMRAASTTRARRRCCPSTPTTRRVSGSSSRPIRAGAGGRASTSPGWPGTAPAGRCCT